MVFIFNLDYAREAADAALTNDVLKLLYLKSNQPMNIILISGIETLKQGSINFEIALLESKNVLFFMQEMQTSAVCYQWLNRKNGQHVLFIRVFYL
jgi:hypothetical protein